MYGISEDLYPHAWHFLKYRHFFFFLWLHLWHMRLPGQGLNPSLSCNQAGAFNSLCQARDGTCASAETQAAAVGFLTHCATAGIPDMDYFWVRHREQKRRCHITALSKLISEATWNMSIYCLRQTSIFASHLSCLLFFFFFISGLFRAAPMAYGNSQARGQIGAVAAGLHHSHSHVGSARSKPSLRPTWKLTATQDP